MSMCETRDMDTQQQYTLKATYRGKTSTVRFHADNDDEATFEALMMVLVRACPSVGEERKAKHTIWAKGLIVLTDSTGKEVRRMEAKVA